MEKAVYGLAADFDAVHFNKQNNQTKYFRLAQVTYASVMAFTIDHEPKKLITTTNLQENGELILVQRGPLLFFKFIPTTKDGERIYRYVKQRRLRHCSYTYHIDSFFRDEQTESKLKGRMSEGDSITTYNGTLYEVCLTNKPRDSNTFTTINAADPLFEGIDWTTNVGLTEVDYWKANVDYWKANVEYLAEVQRIEQLITSCDRSLEQLKKRLNKVGDTEYESTTTILQQT